jgi:nitroimidazol reductase NimA-like FMN-containing flavoprotein (pyridoxamine 5'-phosphate oxidase superfamily)
MIQYHLNKADREITDPGELKRLLNQGKFATVAMCRKDEPYIVSMNYGYDQAEQALYFHSAPQGLKLEFIRENPRVCATIIDDRGYRPGRCEHHYSSLVIAGTMTVLQELEEKKRAMQVLLRHLEADPEPIRRRNLSDDRVYQRVALLKLSIEAMRGKSGK